MSPPKFRRFARAGLLVLGLLVPSACAKKAEVEPVAEQAPAPAPAPQPKPRPSNGKGGGGPSLDPLALFGGSAPTRDEAQALKKKHEALLLGTWTADLGAGATEELTYNPDGTYSAKLAGPTPATASGKYAVVQLVGTKGLKLRLGDDPAARTITAVFTGDELEHPSLRPGVTGTYRKK